MKIKKRNEGGTETVRLPDTKKATRAQNALRPHLAQKHCEFFGNRGNCVETVWKPSTGPWKPWNPSHFFRMKQYSFSLKKRDGFHGFQALADGFHTVSTRFPHGFHGFHANTCVW